MCFDLDQSKSEMLFIGGKVMKNSESLMKCSWESGEKDLVCSTSCLFKYKHTPNHP